jgi:hypothetical protein
MLVYVREYRPRLKRYTSKQVKDALGRLILDTGLESFTATGKTNREKIESICKKANEINSCFLAFPISCGIENWTIRKNIVPEYN